MGRRHLLSKKKLGKELDRTSLSVSRQLQRITAEAIANCPRPTEPPADSLADPGAAYWAATGVAANAADPGFEASVTEDLAVYQGADILFSKNKEGPITALAIILIPEENRQNRRIAALAANFGFVAHISSRRKIAVVVPEGYVTDFASIPGFAHWIVSPFGRHAEAAVIHDWLYTLGDPGDEKGRKLADRTFRRALKLVGVDWLRRSIMYRAVRWGGKSGYGLTTDYDFRDLVELKARDPMPDKSTFAFTWREAEIPRPQRAGKRQKSAAGAPAPAPATQAEAKAEAQDTMVATEAR